MLEEKPQLQLVFMDPNEIVGLARTAIIFVIVGGCVLTWLFTRRIRKEAQRKRETPRRDFPLTAVQHATIGGMSDRPERRPFVRNHYLPRWLHRVANAVFASLLFAGVTLLVWQDYLIVFGGSLAVLLVVLFVNPDRFSIVEGVAGGEGYVDLDQGP